MMGASGRAGRTSSARASAIPGRRPPARRRASIGAATTASGLRWRVRHGVVRPRCRGQRPARSPSNPVPPGSRSGPWCAAAEPASGEAFPLRLDRCCIHSGAGRSTVRFSHREPHPDKRRSDGGGADRSKRSLYGHAPHPYSHDGMISEQPLTVTVGGDLSLEARLALPASPKAGVVICHPHPLYGGDMDNPVVVRVQEVCADLDLATLRFNFRGVGGSGGSHGGGVGELEDAAAALDALEKAMGGGLLAIAGYSFGARGAALLGCPDARLGGLVLIAPPLAMYDFGCFEGRRHLRALMVAATPDPYCPPAAFARLSAPFPLAATAAIDGADHFFFGKLYPLGQAVAEWARHLPREREGR